VWCRVMQCGQWTFWEQKYSTPSRATR